MGGHFMFHFMFITLGPCVEMLESYFKQNAAYLIAISLMC